MKFVLVFDGSDYLGRISSVPFPWYYSLCFVFLFKLFFEKKKMYEDGFASVLFS